MESGRLTLNHSQLKHLNFEDIQKHLAAHYLILLQHDKYISELKQNNTDKSDEINQYLKDVFGIDFDDFDDDEVRILLLQTAEMVLVERLHAAKELVRASKHPNEIVAMCTVKFLLEKNSCWKPPPVTMTGFGYLLNATRGAFLNKGLYLGLKAKLEQMIPKEEADAFSEVFQVKLIYSHSEPHLTSKKNRMVAYAAKMTLHWGRIIATINLKQAQIKEELIRLNKDNDIPIADINTTTKLDEIVKLLREKSQTANVATTADAITDNAAFLFELLPSINNEFKQIEENIKEFKHIIQLKQKYKETYSAIQSKLNQLNNLYEDVTKLLFTVKENSLKRFAKAITNLGLQLHEDKEKISLLQKKWSKDLSNKIINEMQLHDLKHSFLESYHVYSEGLINAKMNLLHYSNQNKEEKQKHELILQQELEQFKVVKLQELSQHKNEVIQKRQEREKEKKQKCQQQKLNHELSFFANSPIETQTHKNIDVENKLFDLSKSNWQILSDVLHLVTGPKFPDVCNLIEKLDGKIISHGGSHRSIKLNKYLVDIVVHEGKDNAPQEEVLNLNANKSGGGFYRQHKKGHNSGVLSRFNLKLIKNAFKKAGITKAIFYELEQKRSENVVRPC